MTPQIEHLIQDIGSELLAVCRCQPTASLLYAEFEDGVVSPSVFFTMAGSSKTIFKFAGQALSSLSYSLRENMAALPNAEEWRAMIYSVQNGKLNIQPIYQAQFDEDLGENKRRVAAAAQILGDYPIDYANP